MAFNDLNTASPPPARAPLGSLAYVDINVAENVIMLKNVSWIFTFFVLRMFFALLHRLGSDTKQTLRSHAASSTFSTSFGLNISTLTNPGDPEPPPS